MPRKRYEPKHKYTEEEVIELLEHNHTFSWLSEDDYAKAVGQLRMQMTGIFDFLKVDEKLPIRYMYGMGPHIPGAINEMIKLAEDFGLRVRDIDKAISLELVRLSRRNHDKTES